MFLLSFSIRVPLSGRFTDWPCLGHRPSPWTGLWLPVPLELHGVREGWFPKGRGRGADKTLSVHDTMVCPLGSPVFFFSWDLSVGEHGKTQVKPVLLPSKHKTLEEVQSQANSWLPLLRPRDSLVPKPGPEPLPCPGSAILRSSGAGRAWLGSRLWSVSYELALWPWIGHLTFLRLSFLIFVSPSRCVHQLSYPTQCFVRCKAPFGW